MIFNVSPYRPKGTRVKTLLSFVFLFAVPLLLNGCEQAPPETEGTQASLKRLSESQYRTIIRDVFGENISVAGRFDPLQRTDGLSRIGARAASVTPFGLEEYARMARSVAAQVVSDTHRATLVPCANSESNDFDLQCASKFFEKLGTLLFRRPLDSGEQAILMDTVRQSFDLQGDYFSAIASGIESLLISPQFLFIGEDTEIGGSGELALTDYAKASRLSFLLWNSGPDITLISAARDGLLNDEDALQEQVDRMLASPRFEMGTRAFFSDMLDLDKIDTIQKDALIFPAFNAEVLVDSREQLLRDLYFQLVVKRLSYPDIFTLRQTYLSPALARIYQVQVPQNMAWFLHEYSEDDPRVGIQTQVSFVGLHSHPGRSSPTLRGEAMRELLLCQSVPDPPADIDFSLFINSEEIGRTTRERLAIHNQEPSCAGCHRITDPIGLALEQFDGIGQFRVMDNGAVIDPSGSLDGISFDDSIGLAKALKENPSTRSCLVNRLYSYALGRAPDNGDRAFLGYLSDKFATDGYDVVDLVRRLVTSEEFFRVSPG